MKTLLIALALAGSALAADLVSCTRNGVPTTGDRFPWWSTQDENATKHYSDPNKCTTWEYPFCIKMNKNSPSYDADEATWEFGCAECRHSCDCPIGKYCQIAYTEQTDFGKCVSYKEKLNKPCDADLDNSGVVTPGDTNKDPFYGDSMLCGVFLQWKSKDYNITVRSQLWKGSCINGKCRECNSYVQYTPTHDDEVWYTQSAQSSATDRTLVCLWDGAGHSFTEDAPYKRKPRVCDNFGWSHTNGISVAAPAAALLLLASAFAL